MRENNCAHCLDSQQSSCKDCVRCNKFLEPIQFCNGDMVKHGILHLHLRGLGISGELVASDTRWPHKFLAGDSDDRFESTCWKLACSSLLAACAFLGNNLPPIVQQQAQQSQEQELQQEAPSPTAPAASRASMPSPDRAEAGCRENRTPCPSMPLSPSRHHTARSGRNLEPIIIDITPPTPRHAARPRRQLEPIIIDVTPPSHRHSTRSRTETDPVIVNVVFEGYRGGQGQRDSFLGHRRQRAFDESRGSWVLSWDSDSDSDSEPYSQRRVRWGRRCRRL